MFCLQELHGIHAGAVLVDLKVQVRSGDVTGGALIADHRTGSDILAGGHCHGAHVSIPSGVSAVVVNHHVIAPGHTPAVSGVCLDDLAVSGGHDGSAGRTGDIQTLVAGIAVVSGGDVRDTGQGPMGLNPAVPPPPVG